MEKSKLFKKLFAMAEIKNPNRGLGVIHSKIINRLEQWELSQFEKQCQKVSFRQIPIKEGDRVIQWLNR